MARERRWDGPQTPRGLGGAGSLVVSRRYSDRIPWPPGEIFVISVAGGEVTRLTGNGGDKSPPSWSPDGTKVAFAHNRSTIAVIDAGDGTPVRDLAIEGVLTAVWSPDGSRIAFTRLLCCSLAAYADLDLISPDGSGRRTIRANSLAPSALVWSPDGTRLLVTAPGGTSHSGSVTFLRADGNEHHPGCRFRVGRAWTRGRGGNSPAWSPDGTKVAFTSERDGRRQIFTANADGTCASQITGPSSIGRGVRSVLAASSRKAAELRTALRRPRARRRFPDPDPAIEIERRAQVHAHQRGQRNGEPPSALSSSSPRRWSRTGVRAAPAPSSSDESLATIRRSRPGRRRPGDLDTTCAPGGGTVTIAAESTQFDGDRTNNQLRLFPTVSRCTALAPRADALVGTSRADVICGNGGADRLTGKAGNDRLFGGANGDTIFGGPGRDDVSGGNGADVIFSDDRQSDSIDCGRGPDRVVADRRDRIARNCERVVRR